MKLCLIISNNNNVRLKIRAIIEDLGFMTYETEDSLIGYISANALQPDVILLDVDTSGAATAEFMEKAAVLKSGKTPLIIPCSSRNHNPDDGKSIYSGSEHLADTLRQEGFAPFNETTH